MKTPIPDAGGRRPRNLAKPTWSTYIVLEDRLGRQALDVKGVQLDADRLSGLVEHLRALRDVAGHSKLGELAVSIYSHMAKLRKRRRHD